MLAHPFCICIGVDATRFPHIQVDESTQKFKLTNTSTVIGSGHGSDIKIEPLGLGSAGFQGEICEQHALIRYDKPANELSVHDTSSPDDARVFVNDVKLHLGAKWRLKIGDTVSIAGYFFRVEANVYDDDSNDHHRSAPAPAPEAATQATALEAARGGEGRVAGGNRDEATTTKKNKKAPAPGAAVDDGFDDAALGREAKRKKQPKLAVTTTTTAAAAAAATAKREYVFKPGEEVGSAPPHFRIVTPNVYG